MSVKFRWPAFRPIALLVLIVSIVRPGLPLGAQTRSISGIVRAPDGAVLPGVTIGLVDPVSSQVLSVTTNDEGRYSVSTPADSAELFILDASLPGWERSVRNITIPKTGSRSTFEFDLTMRPAPVDSARSDPEYDVVEDESRILIALGDPEFKLSFDWTKLDPVSQRQYLGWAGSEKFWTEEARKLENQVGVWVNPLDEVFRQLGTSSSGKLDPIAVDTRIDWNALQTPAVNNAQPAPRTQSKGGLLMFEDPKTTVAVHDPNRLTLPWLGRRLGLAALNVFGARSFGSRSAPPRIDEKHFDRLVIPPAQTRGASGGSPGVKLFFVDTGQSSGNSVTMTVVNEGTKPVTVVGGAFVLEPVQGLSERDVAREIQRLKSRKSVTVTIDAYCLNMRKAPPAAGMVMRLVAKPEAAVLKPLQKIASAARVLYRRAADHT